MRDVRLPPRPTQTSGACTSPEALPTPPHWSPTQHSHGLDPESRERQVPLEALVSYLCVTGETITTTEIEAHPSSASKAPEGEAY